MCVQSGELFSPAIWVLLYTGTREGGSSQGVSAFCVAELAELVTSLLSLPLGQVNIVLCTSVHLLRSAQLFQPGP